MNLFFQLLQKGEVNPCEGIKASDIPVYFQNLWRILKTVLRSSARSRIQERLIRQVLYQNSYKDQMIMQALLKDMSDTDIRTRVLSRTQNNELLTLHAIIDYIAAEEASYFFFASLQHPHSRQIHCKARKWQKVCQKNILNQINVSYFVDFKPLKPIKLCLKGFIFAIRIWSFGTFSP